MPPSMRKVGPSETSSDEWVYLLAVRASPSTTCKRVGKRLARLPLPKNELPVKKLSPMLETLWKALGVPVAAIEMLRKKHKDEKGEHAYVAGFADSMGAMPAGHIFATGLLELCKVRKISHVFVTRTPCVEATDGQLLPVVTDKPKGMTDDDWELLRDMPFGSVKFSALGSAPMLASLAEGDLDGDLYFVAWDAELSRHLENAGIAGKPRATDVAVPARAPKTKPGPRTTQEDDRWSAFAKSRFLPTTLSGRWCTEPLICF